MIQIFLAFSEYLNFTYLHKYAKLRIWENLEEFRITFWTFWFGTFLITLLDSQRTLLQTLRKLRDTIKHSSQFLKANIYLLFVYLFSFLLFSGNWLFTSDSFNWRYQWPPSPVCWRTIQNSCGRINTTWFDGFSWSTSSWYVKWYFVTKIVLTYCEKKLF